MEITQEMIDELQHDLNNYETLYNLQERDLEDNDKRKIFSSIQEWKKVISALKHKNVFEAAKHFSMISDRNAVVKFSIAMIIAFRRPEESIVKITT